METCASKYVSILMKSPTKKNTIYRYMLNLENIKYCRKKYYLMKYTCGYAIENSKSKRVRNAKNEGKKRARIMTDIGKGDRKLSISG